MAKPRLPYSRIFFKLLLLALYFVFFTVQLFLRFTSPQSQQLLGIDYSKSINNKKVCKNSLCKSQKGNKENASYLNKHFQPKEELFVSSLIFQFHNSYRIVLSNFFYRADKIKDSKSFFTSLRGPPSLG